MFIILESTEAQKKLSTVPREILIRYEKWKDIIYFSGPTGLREIKGFHDEKLTGVWSGHRSSRLGSQWRVIYKIISDHLTVKVIRVAAHDYRKN